MPEGFRYENVFRQGRPRHDRYDPFRIRHPKMDVGHRAKIFAPFDALKGFHEAVDAEAGRMAAAEEVTRESVEEEERNQAEGRSLHE